MTLNLSSLESKALAATKGPWFTGYAAVHSEPLNDEYQRIEKTGFSAR